MDPVNQSPDHQVLEDDDISESHFCQELDETSIVMRILICEWLTHILDLEEGALTEDTFLKTLDDGVILCRLATLITDAHNGDENAAKTIKPPKYRSRAVNGVWHARDNISVFLDWCSKEVGVMEVILFTTNGLVDHLEEKNVILTLMELARFGGGYGLDMPKLIRMERWIDETLQSEQLFEDTSRLEDSIEFSRHYEDSVNSSQHLQESVNSSQHLQDTANTSEPLQDNFNSSQHLQDGATSSQHLQDTVNTSEHLQDNVNSSKHFQDSIISDQQYGSVQIEAETAPHMDTIDAPEPVSLISRQTNNNMTAGEIPVETERAYVGDMVSRLIQLCTCTVPFRVEHKKESFYRLGGRDCFMRLITGHVMVRVGGGWSSLAEYLARHDPCRMARVPRTGGQGFLVPQGRSKRRCSPKKGVK